MIELTVEKAIEILRQTYKEESDGYQEHLVRGGGISYQHEEWLQALGMAIHELKKRIPVKPINYEDKMWGCPTCHNYLMHIWVQYPIERTPKECGLAYCLNCGQAIDWSDER